MPLELPPLEEVVPDVLPEEVELEVVPEELELVPELEPELEAEPLEELLEEPLDEPLEELLEEPFEELFEEPFELELPPLLDATAGPPSSLIVFSFWSNMASTVDRITVDPTTTTTPIAAATNAYSTALEPLEFRQTMVPPGPMRLQFSNKFRKSALI